MKTLFTHFHFLSQNSGGLLESIQEKPNLNTIINILSIGFITILLLLGLNLIKVYKQKRKIELLESQQKPKQKSLH